MAEQSYRTLALAVKLDGLGDLATYNGSTTHPGHKIVLDADHYVDVETDLVLLGIVGIQDPPRKEVRGSLKECGSAGIRVMMITGDNRVTAEAISKDIGILSPEQAVSENSIEGRA